MTAGQRFRMVTITNDEEHVSSVILNEDEILTDLALQARLLEAFGWIVDRSVDGVVSAGRNGVKRTIFPRAYSPLEDLMK